MKTTRPLVFSVLVGATLAIGLGMPTPAEGQRGPIYYRMGGGRPVPPSANMNVNLAMGVGFGSGANFSCGKFDVKASIKGVLDDVKNAADDLQNAMVQAAQSAIASLPTLILQRLNPGLYDIFQNALLEAKARVNVSVASCQQLEAAMAANPEGNPFEGWVRVSRWASWRSKGLINSSGVVGTHEEVKQDNGRDGAPWICTDRGEEHAGGQNQRTIRPIRDGVMTGINILLGRHDANARGSGCANANFSSARSATSGEQRLARLFSDPQEVADFTRDVRGDMDVATYDGDSNIKKHYPGMGILPFVERDQALIFDELNRVVNDPNGTRLRDNLDAPQIEITEQAINALRDMQGAERATFADRLASEMAVARNVEKLLLARRALIASRDLPEVRNEVASREINKAIDDLQGQVEELMFESRIRHELVSNTALLLLEQQASRRFENLNITNPNTGGGVEHGAPARGAIVE